MSKLLKCKTCDGNPKELESECASCGFYHEKQMEKMEKEEGEN